MKKIQMKKNLILLLLGLTILPTVVFAAVMDHTNLIPKDKVIEGNYYLASDNPVVLGTVNGDLAVFGGNITVSGDIKDDLFVAGGNVTVNGNIGGDARIFGGTVNFDGKTGGEVIIMTGHAVVGSAAQVGKDLTIGSGDASVDPAAKVAGKNIIYTKENGEEILRPRGFVNEMMQSGMWIAKLLWVLALMLFGLCLFLLVPKFIKKEAHFGADGKNGWKNLGIGLAALIMTPVVAVICLVSQIAAIIGLVLIFGYIIMILTGITFAGFVFGNLAKIIIEKNDKAELNLVWAMGGIVVLHLITLIPYIGPLTAFIFFLVALGSMVINKWNLARELK
jgi:hypothetical protein